MTYSFRKLLRTTICIVLAISSTQNRGFAYSVYHPNSENFRVAVLEIAALNLVSINPAAICQGGQTSITYNPTGYPVGTTFAAEFSNSAGSFAAPVNLGTLGLSPSNVTIPVTSTPSFGYQIRIRASDGTFSNSLPLRVKKLPNPFILPGGSASICAGQAAQLTAHPAPMVDINSYSWFLNSGSIAGNTNIQNVVTPGSYTVLIDSMGCSKLSAPVSVSNQPVPNAFISGSANVVVCKNGLAPIPVTLNANTGTGLAYQWFNGINPISPNGTSAALVISASGTYTVKVTVTATGCNSTSSAVNAVEAQVPPVPFAGLDSAVCSEDTVIAGFQPGPGNTAVFNWVPATNVLDFFTQQPSPNSTYVRITLKNSGNLPKDSIFTLFARDPATGCFSQDQVKITCNPNPTVTVGINRTVCENGTPISLFSSPLPGNTGPGIVPAGSGIWIGTGLNVVGTLATFTPNPALVGPNPLTFEYRTDWKNGGKTCGNKAQMTVTVLDSPEPIPGDPQSFCNGIDSVQLTGYTPANGIWSGTGISASGKFYPSGLPIGVYRCTLSVTSAQGCIGFATRDLTVTSAPIVEAGPLNQSICSNVGPKQLIGFSPAGGTWSGTNTSSGGIFVADSAISGIHVLRYTYKKDGCTGRDSIFMTVIQAPKVRTGKYDTTCANDSAKTLVGATPAGGHWKGNGVDASGTIFTPSPALIGSQLLMYKITLNGCPDSAVRIMFVKQAPVVDAGANDTICASVDSLKMVGFSPAIGKWSGQGMDSTGIFRPKKNHLIGNIPVTYKVKSSNGCSSSDQKQITVNALPLAVAGIDTAFCTGLSIQIGSNPQPKLAYLWIEPIPNCLSNDTIANPILTIVNNQQIPDTFRVRLNVTDSVTQCINMDTMRVIVYPKPTATVSFPGVKTGCAGDSFILKAKTRKGLIYEWLRNGLSLNIPAEKDSVLRTINSGRYRLVVRNKGAICTDTSLSDSLTIFPRYIPQVKGLPFFCKDSTTQLTVQPQNEGFTYQWQFNGKNVPDSTKTTFTIGKTGTVRVILRTDKGCRDSSLTIPIDSLPFPFTGNISDTTICEGGTAIFKAPTDSLFSYRWTDSLGIVLSTDDSLITRKVGSYFLAVSNSCRVSVDTVRLVEIHPLPLFSILANDDRQDTLVCIGLPVILFGPGGFAGYRWSDSLRSSNIQGFELRTNEITDYPLKLKVTDQFGCAGNDSVRVHVIDCPPQIYIPSAFSPDNNLINDVWRLQGYDIEEFKLYVFNRWGQMVYFSKDKELKEAWDGSFNGTPCLSGAYKYYIEYSGTLGGEDVPKKISGTVTILR